MTELCTTSLKTANEQDRIRHLVDDASGLLQSEHRPVFINLSEKYLLRAARIPEPETMLPDPFGQLDYARQQIVYWQEIDRLIQCIRGYVFRQTTSRIIVTLETKDAITRAAAMRLAIELAIWGSYFQYGLTSAFNVLQRELSSVDTDGILCADLENYVRGALSVGDARRVAATRSLGLELQPECRSEPGSASTDEFDAVFKKQVDTVRSVASQLPEHLGLAELPTAIDRLYSSYQFFCSLTHVTPVLLMAAGDPDLTDDQLAVYSINAACLCLLLLHELYFNQRYDNLRFVSLLDRVSCNHRSGLTEIPLDFLRDMKMKNRSLSVRFSDGTTRDFYKAR